MKRRRRIVILHPADAPPADLPDLVRALNSEGAEVVVACAAPFERVLDAIEDADSVFVWR
jgi:hypothetical protein